MIKTTCYNFKAEAKKVDFARIVEENKDADCAVVRVGDRCIILLPKGKILTDCKRKDLLDWEDFQEEQQSFALVDGELTTYFAYGIPSVYCLRYVGTGKAVFNPYDADNFVRTYIDLVKRARNERFLVSVVTYEG